MPYSSDEELPERVKSSLPTHAKHIYRKAFNNAFERYKDPRLRRGGSSESREAVAHKVALSAVKKRYDKVARGKWVGPSEKEVKSGGSSRSASRDRSSRTMERGKKPKSTAGRKRKVGKKRTAESE